MNQSKNQRVTEVFVEQPLALPGAIKRDQENKPQVGTVKPPVSADLARCLLCHLSDPLACLPDMGQDMAPRTWPSDSCHAKLGNKAKQTNILSARVIL